MPVATFLHDGDALDYTPAADTAAGTVIVEGDLIGITKHDIAAGERGAMAVTGVFNVPVEDLEFWSVGQKAYWSSADQWIVNTDLAGSAVYLGKVVYIPPSGTTVSVRLEQ